MSDSDDTNVLLLIPPNYFLAESSSAEGSCCSELLGTFASVNDLRGIAPLCMSNDHRDNVELDTINWKLSSFERKLKEEHNLTSNSPPPEKLASKMSINYANQRPTPSAEPLNFTNGALYHSTPNVKNGSAPLRDANFIREIDHLLDERNSPATTGIDCAVPNSDYKSLATRAIQKHNHMAASHSAAHQPNQYDGHNVTTGTTMYRPTEPATKTISPEPPLMSLSAIWSSDAHADSATHQEERMRRQHCEKTIQMLQGRLLECQQKIAVAIKVDRKKDDALAKLHEQNASLVAKIHQMEVTLQEVNERMDDAMHGAAADHAKVMQKNQRLEDELSQTIGMAKKLQERNELLEAKSDSLTKTSTEIRDIHRKQLEDLEIRVSNGRQTEQLLHAELDKLKQQNATLQSNFNDIGKKHEQAMQEEMAGLEKQRLSADEKVRDERARADHLDKQKQSLSATVEALVAKEKALRKELDSQRVSLKAYYQAQLEQVVAKKVYEFQKQLDTVEDTLRAEAKQRERLIAERAIKQMELVNQKNDQEFGLLTEKHNEETELYRFQLANASKTVNQLELKLNAYQSRRSDIADRLHNVMEAQWKQTLEIIASPVTAFSAGEATNGRKVTSSFDASHLDRDRADGVAGLQCQHRPENETFETPVRHRQRHHEAIDGKIGTGVVSSKGSDKLQQYIELLLRKSPRDLDQLDAIMNEPSKPVSTIMPGSGRKEVATKQPWK